MAEDIRGLLDEDPSVLRGHESSGGEPDLADLITAWFRAARLDAAQDSKTYRPSRLPSAGAKTKTVEPLTKRGPA